jgi:hypothetical protein
MSAKILQLLLSVLLFGTVTDLVSASDLPLSTGVFEQQIHQGYTTLQGLPDNDIQQIFCEADDSIVAVTSKGTARFEGTEWSRQDGSDPAALSTQTLSKEQRECLEGFVGSTLDIRDIAESQGEIAVAADAGLYIGNGETWRMALPQQDTTRWAPVDVRAVIYDNEGRLWFAALQGVGYRISNDEWQLFTGNEGLPYNDFTCMAAGPKGVWFGTTNGAILYRDGQWFFRQGRRWLLDNHVRDIAVDTDGNVWMATSAGVSCIASQPMTLADKAAFYESEIERYHRRTRFGYVAPVEFSTPGDKDSGTPVFTDNDGHYTGLYLGAVSLGYTATGREKLRQDAVNAFHALAFLSEVTQGGSHPAPKGFIARVILPTSEPDPNPQFDLAYDQRRNKADSLWKIIQPRWPVDETGEWYWKNDSSSDELDGHFFGFGIYYDRVCKTEEEKEAVREVVRRIMDHVLDNNYTMIDYDGKPTRWGHFSPDDMNRNEAWSDERGLNSFSILTYLAVTYHITGDQKYRDAYLELALDHGYGMNGMTQPKCLPGPYNFGLQTDDNMAFMNYYHLIRYETDPKLLSMFYYAIYWHWQYEKLERNAFTNFVYAASCHGKVRQDQWGVTDLSPSLDYFSESIDTLKRFPLDLLDWPMSNAHRIDLKLLWDENGPNPEQGGLKNGRTLPIDERHETCYAWSPWTLSGGGKGTKLRHGVPYLLPYYMGLAHGFIKE